MAGNRNEGGTPSQNNVEEHSTNVVVLTEISIKLQIY